MRTNIRRTACLLGALVGCLVTVAVPNEAPAGTARTPQPKITLSRSEAGAGANVTVRGSGWRPDTLLTLLMCGQNAIGGTNACANAEGRAVTTDKNGRFRKKIPVAEPPKPCPCVVRATTVTGAYAAANAKLRVAGHPVEPLPEKRTGGRLSVLAARLEGDSGLLNWFGAPEQRKLVLTVGNLGADRARDPVFEVGTSHGVLAPGWERQQWRGTIDPGKKARVELPVELASGAHGEYTVAAKLDRRVLTEQPWEVGRPWGVTLFWVLLCAVVPLAVFRLGMVLVARTRSPSEGAPSRGAATPSRRNGGKEDGENPAE
ncbi:neocarzinostatin apoprotein domain-containing protein [Streptomyces sp. 8N114]|uniref:neocarzinostatin apoprotein domain-containing protein n=1 Tax=Streptomyces sp. 8N114 TaxID=3457419 RepID=UPI003FD182F6